MVLVSSFKPATLKYLTEFRPNLLSRQGVDIPHHVHMESKIYTRVGAPLPVSVHSGAILSKCRTRVTGIEVFEGMSRSSEALSPSKMHCLLSFCCQLPG